MIFLPCLKKYGGSSCSGLFHPGLDVLEKGAGLTDVPTGWFATVPAGPQRCRRLLLDDAVVEGIVAPEKGMLRPWRALFQGSQKLPEQAPVGPLGVRALAMVERKFVQHAEEKGLPFRDLPEGEEAGDQPLFDHPVGAEAGELLDVGPGEVHEDGLGDIVEVQAHGKVAGAYLLCCAVEAEPSEDPAVAAGGLLPSMFGYLVHPMAYRIPEAHQMKGKAEFLALLPDKGNAVLTVACDALVNADGSQPDQGILLEDPVKSVEGEDAVLAA